MLPSSLRRSAIPSSESRTYLQIHQLSAERKRLERSIREWRLRLEEAEAQLGKIDARIGELQQVTEPVRPSVLMRMGRSLGAYEVDTGSRLIVTTAIGTHV